MFESWGVSSTYFGVVIRYAVALARPFVLPTKPTCGRPGGISGGHPMNSGAMEFEKWFRYLTTSRSLGP